MAKRDVNLYLCEVEEQYLEMTSSVKELEEDAQKGLIDPETYAQLTREADLLKANYERIAYIIFLLNKPNRKGNEKADLYKDWYDQLKYASKEAIINENKDVLAHFKKVLTEAKGK